MKKLTVLILLLFALVSCSNDDNSPTNYSGKWQLTEMSGDMENTVTTGADMAWQEFYILNSDGTFKKSRDTDGDVIAATGIYTVITDEGQNTIQLIYENENDIIGSCYANPLKEEMNILAENTFYSIWLACDGPDLKYERI